MLSLSFFGEDGNLSLENYRGLLSEPRQHKLLANSMLLGAGSALFALVLGAPLGVLLARTEVYGKHWWRLALVIPLVLPPYISALAWTWLGLPSDVTYSLTGAIVVLGVSFFPLTMLATEAAARRVDVRLEEAALVVAPPRRVFAQITLPLIAPALAAATLMIFVLAISEFGAPGLLRINVFTTEVFTAFAALYDFGAATALALPLLLTTLIAAIIARLIIGDQMITTRRNPAFRPTLESGRWRGIAQVFLLITVALFVALPLIIIAREAGSFERIAASFNDSGRSIANSFILAGSSATLAVMLGMLLGYARARMRALRLSILVDLLLIALFAVPGTIAGIGLIGLWNHPDWRGDFYTSRFIIVAGYLARFVPVAALLLASNVRQISVASEEAAAVAGASWPRTIFRIVLPQMVTGLVAAWVVAFIFCMGEISATLLVAPPGESTLPIRVYTLIANTSASRLAALALTQAAIVIVPLALFGIVARERKALR